MTRIKQRSISLIALGVLAGCGGPLEPAKQEDRMALYSGQWRGVIGDFQVVVQVEAVAGFFAPVLNGTGYAVNRTTGETTRLMIHGIGTMTDANKAGSLLNIEVASENVGAAARIGQFAGHLSSDRRSWPGHYQALSHVSDFVDLFRVDDVPVTFTKD